MFGIEAGQGKKEVGEPLNLVVDRRGVIKMFRGGWYLNKGEGGGVLQLILRLQFPNVHSLKNDKFQCIL